MCGEVANVGAHAGGGEDGDDAADGLQQWLDGVARGVHALQRPQHPRRIVARQRRPLEHPVETLSAVAVAAAVRVVGARRRCRGARRRRREAGGCGLCHPRGVRLCAPMVREEWCASRVSHLVAGVKNTSADADIRAVDAKKCLGWIPHGFSLFRLVTIKHVSGAAFLVFADGLFIIQSPFLSFPLP